MKKILCLVLLISLVLPFMSSVNIDVEQLSNNEVLVVDLDKPVIFDLKMINLETSDTFEFYNLPRTQVEQHILDKENLKIFK